MNQSQILPRNPHSLISLRATSGYSPTFSSPLFTVMVPSSVPALIGALRSLVFSVYSTLKECHLCLGMTSEMSDAVPSFTSFWSP